MKIKPVNDYKDEPLGYAFYCPGCKWAHMFYISGPTIWKFDGNLESPTFTPSLLNRAPNHANPAQRVCHLFLTAGKLHFCGDCTHSLAGQTVDLPEYPYDQEKPS